MKCMYCGQDNPDGAVFCVCGRPLSLHGGYNNPFPMQTPDMVKHRKAVPKTPFIILLVLVLGVAGFFGYKKLLEKSITDESTWHNVTGDGYSITVPKTLKKGEMLTVGDSDIKLVDFYTSQDVGFDVCVCQYTEEEKAILGGLSVQEVFNIYTADGRRTRKINDQELKFKVREGKNYFYAGVNRHCINHIGKTDEVYYIEAIFPYKDCYYQVDVYCAETDKDKYEETLLKWLDSFDHV